MAKNLWTKEELILTFNLYLKLPFGKLHKGTPEVMNLASITGRSVNSIAIRLSNFASCDPYHKNRGVKGLVGGLIQCQPIWNEFFNNQEELLYLSESILADKEKVNIEEKFKLEIGNIKNLKGETRLTEVKTRVNQSIFRKIVLMNYENKCAISGIDVSELLVASHIIPWAKNEKERLNPENGICLSPLHDKLFDKGFITINDKFKIVISKQLKENSNKNFYANHFKSLENKEIDLPIKYSPNIKFLEYHSKNIFRL